MVVKMRIYILYFVFAVIVTCCITGSACSIWCYSCTYTRTDPKEGAECITDPVTTASKLKCDDPQKCTTHRVYGLSNKEINSFARGCTVDKGNYCTKDVYSETCFTSCNSDYCNDGDGVPGTKPTTSPPNFMCYHCTLQSDIDSNTTSCVEEPWNVTTPHHKVACKYPKMCTIERDSNYAPKGMNLYGFKRGCTGFKVNACTKHALFESCSTSCRGDYCNYGDGIPLVSGGRKVKTHLIGITVSMGILTQYLLSQ